MIFSGNPVLEGQRALFGALAVSLLVHLAPAAAVARWWAGAASEATPAVRGSALVAVFAAADDARPAPARNNAAVPLRQPPTADRPATTRWPDLPVDAATAGGWRRLLADPPDDLARPAGPPDDRWYFPRAELTVAPRLIEDPVIDWPLARPGETPSSGTIVLRVLVGFDGVVDGVEATGGDLPVAYQESAAAGFARARFVPGEIAGVAVTSELRFEVFFDPGVQRRSQ
ncbi:hypothetical protein [Accumulibacter sp.]|uniref:hypothetical protein n=1 Tax=Accumulibacter sp. TaxID=2053492 RepID=UPI0025E5509F|nr:hypothetical protein [Accumulibacter sp.]MCM8594781.1 hypothetical protein [Accumulibacter sp.]MCM8625114.1 hypothetical protein [Accumulibacter sp.]MDS4048926.1 hypothetical protein [Accumulibacter sp.]